MRISTNTLSTFVKCPILLREGRLLAAPGKRITNYLRKAIQYLYSYQLSHGHQCNFNELIKRWNQLWWGKKKPTDEDSDKLSNEAYFAMGKYYDHYIDIDSEPIAVNFPYSVDFRDHVLTGTWPVVLNNNEEAELYYPLSQKTTHALLRDIVVRADIVALYLSTGNPPIKVTHSVYDKKVDDHILFSTVYPKNEWLEKATTSTLQIIEAITRGYDWGNCHACRKCELRSKCTG